MHQVLLSIRETCGYGASSSCKKGRPIKRRVPSGLVRTHEDATSGVPKHGFVVNYAVKVKIQNHVSAARRGRRDVGCRDACRRFSCGYLQAMSGQWCMEQDSHERMVRKSAVAHRSRSVALRHGRLPSDGFRL